MKKLFTFLVLAIGLVSCQTEPEGFDVNVGGEQNVNITVSLPESTRAASNQGFDFTNFESNSDYDLRFILEISYNGKVVREVKTTETTSATFPVRLAPNKNYTFTVWADLVNEGSEEDLYYNTASLSNITFKSWTPNVEARDAYTLSKTINFNAAADLSMELKRPFAKVRVVATDLDKVTAFNLNPTNAVAEYFTAEMYTKFDAVNGRASEVATKKHEFSYTNVDTYSDVTGQFTVFADYVFVPEDGNVQFTLDILAGTERIKLNNFNTAIPVEANKVTSIVGDVLTEGGNVNITIDGTLEEKETINYVNSASSLQEVINNIEVGSSATIELGGDVVIGASASTSSTRAATRDYIYIAEGKTVVLDLTGFNISHSDVENKYAFNNHGTLIIKDSKGGGSINARGIYNGYGEGAENVTTAKIIVESGVINAKGTNGGAAIFNYGVVEVKGGKFESNGGYGLNNQSGASMTITGGEIRGGIYNLGTLNVDGENTSVYQHISGRHAIYNYAATAIINNGAFDSESGNELILADGENSSVTINGGTFDKTAKSWLMGAATGKNITFVIKGGTFRGYVNQPEMTVDTFRPYGDPIVVYGGNFNFNPTQWLSDDYTVEVNDGNYNVVLKPAVAMIGEEGYTSIQKAVTAAQNGDTILFVADVEQEDGVIITDKNITIDLNDKTFTVSNGASTNNRNFKVNGSSVVTIKNGTMVAAGNYSSGAYGTLRTEGTANVTLENIKLYNYRGNGLNVKALSGTTVTINNTEVYSEYGGGIESTGGTIELTNVKVEQKGMYTAPYNSMAISVNGRGTVTVNSGTYSTECITAEEANNQGTSHGPWCAGVLNSGGTLIIKGGTFSNDNFGENTLATYARGLLLADTGANIQIQGGTFNAVKAIIDIQNNLGDASKNPSATISGGNFSADPLTWDGLIKVADGYVVDENNGRYEVVLDVKVAKVGNTEYRKIDDAIAAWTNNTTLTLMSDVTLNDVITINSTEHHILDLATYTLTAADGKNAFEIVAKGTGASERTAITIKADATNPGAINAGSKSVVYYNYANGTATGDDRPIIKIEGGVFYGATSSFGTAGIYFKGGSAARHAATLNISGGEFYCSINGQSKSKLLISGGLFHYSVGSQGDSTALRLISGGTFKTLGFMTADSNNTKFWFGTSMGNSNVGLYINDDNYLVVGGPVITEFGDKFAAKATNATKWSSYLQYSSAAANGLYYTNAEMAIKKHGEANVVLK